MRNGYKTASKISRLYMKPHNTTFLSIISGNDKTYEPIYKNFTYWLNKLNLPIELKLVRADFNTEKYGSTEFNNLMRYRFTAIQEELLKDRVVIFTDLDVVFLKNPLPLVLNLLKKYEGVYSPDAGCKCMGFFGVNPTESNKRLFDSSYFMDKDSPNKEWKEGETIYHDQHVLNMRFNRDPYFQKLRSRHYLLDENDFPYGRHWFSNAESIKDPYLVHYNWVIGVEGKIQRMKEYNHWYRSKK
jgi:hypothetical protein